MSVKHAVLALLYQRPMYGYELSKMLGLSLRNDWEVNSGQIAGTLTRLEKSGLATHEIQQADAAPDRKVYYLTQEGERELETWYLTPEVREYQIDDDFYKKFIFSLVGAPATPENVISIQRQRLYQELHDVIELRDSADDDSKLPLVLLLETVIVHLKADIEWIEMCDSHLEALKQFHPPKPEPKPRGRPRLKPSKETA